MRRQDGVCDVARKLSLKKTKELTKRKVTIEHDPDFGTTIMFVKSDGYLLATCRLWKKMGSGENSLLYYKKDPPVVSVESFEHLDTDF